MESDWAITHYSENADDQRARAAKSESTSERATHLKAAAYNDDMAKSAIERSKEDERKKVELIRDVRRYEKEHPEVSSSGGCFIATVSGATDEELDVLRKYRNEVLMSNPLGRTFVSLYYDIGPYLAEAISDYPAIKGIVKRGVARLVQHAKQVLE
jgi:hypothetical protein